MRTIRKMLMALALGGSPLAFAPSIQAQEAEKMPDTQETLTPFLRQLLLQSMPQPLGQHPGNWGQMRDVMVGMRINRFKPEVVRDLRNDGLWQRVRVEAIDPQSTFSFHLDSIKPVDAHTSRFEATMGLPVRAIHEQQLWKSGKRLYGGEVRGRTTVTIRVVGEMTTRFERGPNQLLPTAVVRVHVTQADVDYSPIVCEKILGLEGQPAKLVGEMALKALRTAKPGFEGDMKAKANTAILKAADTKEVRVELLKLFPGRPTKVQ
ncbi:MAG: hypothetical protein ACRC8S_09245 [Fimbriiglobus sp.]